MSFRRVSGSSPGDELQNARRRFMLMLLIMIGVCCVIMGVMTATLYQYEVRRQRALLQANAQSQARLIEAVARYDQAQAAAHSRQQWRRCVDVQKRWDRLQMRTRSIKGLVKPVNLHWENGLGSRLFLCCGTGWMLLLSRRPWHSARN